MRKKSESRKPRANEQEPEVGAGAEAAGDEAESETTTVATPPTDNVGDISVEVNVEDLIAQLESESKGVPAADGSARRKIEDILEEKRVAKEIMDMEDFDIDE